MTPPRDGLSVGGERSQSGGIGCRRHRRNRQHPINGHQRPTPADDVAAEQTHPQRACEAGVGQDAGQCQPAGGSDAALQRAGHHAGQTAGFGDPQRTTDSPQCGDGQHRDIG